MNCLKRYHILMFFSNKCMYAFFSAGVPEVIAVLYVANW